MAVSQSSVSTWSSKQVSGWLKQEGFGQYVELLCSKHRVDGLSLLTLGEADLREPPLGLTVLGDIKRLALALRRLQRQNQDQLEEMGIGLMEIGLGGLGAAAGRDRACHGDDWGDHRADRWCNGGEHVCNRAARRQMDCGVSGSWLGSRPRSGTELEEDQCHIHSTGDRKCVLGRLDPELWKTVVSSVYVMLVFGFTSFVMVIVHNRVPDMTTYPPLPDIFLDSVPRIPWAFAMAEACGLILVYIFLLVLLLHKH
ncbi:sphingomyelin synthase-related protein 1-like, partial [Coregonus clupeaformis]|uniref:sphingomyelin synthase-related protein 1-like n=1 Tax=Coregonus clupeaformis TaxID=59861 RepID=UPI001E1C760E